MITREILEAQRANYVQGREAMTAQLSALNGGIDAIDNLLRILDQGEAALASEAAPAQPSENGTEKEKAHA